jgi:hypothetical protein
MAGAIAEIAQAEQPPPGVAGDSQRHAEEVLARMAATWISAMLWVCFTASRNGVLTRFASVLRPAPPMPGRRAGPTPSWRARTRAWVDVDQVSAFTGAPPAYRRVMSRKVKLPTMPSRAVCATETSPSRVFLSRAGSPVEPIAMPK